MIQTWEFIDEFLQQCFSSWLLVRQFCGSTREATPARALLAICPAPLCLRPAPPHLSPS